MRHLVEYLGTEKELKRLTELDRKIASGGPILTWNDDPEMPQAPLLVIYGGESTHLFYRDGMHGHVSVIAESLARIIKIEDIKNQAVPVSLEYTGQYGLIKSSFRDEGLPKNALTKSRMKVTNLSGESIFPLQEVPEHVYIGTKEVHRGLIELMDKRIG